MYLYFFVKRIEIYIMRYKSSNLLLLYYKRCSSVTEMIKELEWPSLSERCSTTSSLTMMYKILNGLVAIPPEEFFNRNTSRTRKNHNLTLQTYQPRGNIDKFAFVQRSIPEWNKLPGSVLPYFGKRKQVTYHPNLSYWCFHNSHNEIFFQAKFHVETLILLRDMLGKTSWYSIDVSENDRHILLFYEKCHFCHLLPFAKLGQCSPLKLTGSLPGTTIEHLSQSPVITSQ